MTKPESSTDNPGIKFPPPLIFFLTGLAGWLLGKTTGWLVFLPGLALEIGAFSLLAIGFLLFFWSMLPFLVNKTSALPWTADSKLLVGGPYRFSRNPMYASMALLYLGISLQLGSGIAIILLVPVIFIMNQYVIKGEEAYLTRTFGEEYRNYQQKVRRWL